MNGQTIRKVNKCFHGLWRERTHVVYYITEHHVSKEIFFVRVKEGSKYDGSSPSSS